MNISIMTSVSSIILLGIAAEWLAWRLRFPTILVLLLFGFLAGPVSGYLDPDLVLGEMLFPFVSISVAIILFEGGLTLRFSEIRESMGVVRNLVTVGILVTWITVSLAAFFIVNLNIALSILLGAILVVTGPTVVIPMLRHIHIKGNVDSIARWEGIVNDPIGAVFTVLVFEVILAGEIYHAVYLIPVGIIKTLLLGGILGYSTAKILLFLFRKHWVPDLLHNPVTLTAVLGAFIISNRFQHESGLLTVTIMGIVMVNQSTFNIKHIIEFKENLRILLISSLFIVLAARVKLDDLTNIILHHPLFLITLVFLVRPLAVLFSTIRSGLNWKEKLLLSWLAPRGIVAAAVASVFSLEMIRGGHPEAEILVPMTFMVIVGTVLIYGFTTPILAKLLRLSNPDPQGIILLGAHGWAVKIASAVQEAGFSVILVDSNHGHVKDAKDAGLNAYHGNILSKETTEELDFHASGRFMAMTPNDEVNSLAVLHFQEFFPRKEVYQIAPADENCGEDRQLRSVSYGRILFGDTLTFCSLDRCFAFGGVILTGTELERKEVMRLNDYPISEIPLFVIKNRDTLIPLTADSRMDISSDMRLITLLYPSVKA